MFLSKGLRSINAAVESGWLIFFAAILALVGANSGLATVYLRLVNTEFGGVTIMTLVNDVLMSVFFLAVGIEIKREILFGHLKNNSQRILPVFTAAGGFIVPMLIYLAFNYTGAAAKGAAIPAATDIAFTMGAISLFSSFIPVSLRIFVMALAIVDDMMAVATIAVFYTQGIKLCYLSGGIVALGALYWLQRRQSQCPWGYVVLGGLLWWLVERSGIHATIAGVLLGLMMPQLDPVALSEIKGGGVSGVAGSKGAAGAGAGRCLAVRLRGLLDVPINYIILPLFALLNSGVQLEGELGDLLGCNVVQGVMFGLLIGKPLGIFSVFYFLVRRRIVPMPAGATYVKAFVVACFCGIGFTMSIFVSLLAFGEERKLFSQAKVGIISGSVLSLLVGIGLIGFLHFVESGRRRRGKQQVQQGSEQLNLKSRKG